jgi:DNA polymerase-1
MQAELAGFSLCSTPGEAAYVPLNHKSGSGDLLGGGLVEGQIAENDALDRLKPLLEDDSILIVGQNLKYDWLVMRRHGITIACLDDTMLLSYVIDGGSGHARRPWHGRAVGALARPHADRLQGHRRHRQETADLRHDRPRRGHEIRRRGRRHHAAPVEGAQAAGSAKGLVTVYERLERPLVAVLARMEARGIPSTGRCCRGCRAISRRKLAAMEAEIYESPARASTSARRSSLARSCSARWACRAGRRPSPASGRPAQVLEDLAVEGHELPRRIVDWRQMTKLKSTYTDALPGYINPETKRVHTSYSLAATSTGRLSSSEPNLQNIPIRTGGPAHPHRPSSPRRATSWSPPTTARSNCACSPMSPTSRS